MIRKINYEYQKALAANEPDAQAAAFERVAEATRIDVGKLKRLWQGFDAIWKVKAPKRRAPRK